MKTIAIHSRTILVRTGYKAHPYAEATQYVIRVGSSGNPIRNGHFEDVGNPRHRVPFTLEIKTRSPKALAEFAGKLGRKDAEKWLKAEIGKLLEEAGK